MTCSQSLLNWLPPETGTKVLTPLDNSLQTYRVLKVFEAHVLLENRGEIDLNSIALPVTQHGGISQGNSVIPVVHGKEKPIERKVLQIAISPRGALYFWRRARGITKDMYTSP